MTTPEPSPIAPLTRREARRWATRENPPSALLWVDPANVMSPGPPDTTRSATSSLVGRRRRRTGALVPVGMLATLIGAYAATTLLWPLDELAPVVRAETLPEVDSPPTMVQWPVDGAGGVMVSGFGPAASQSVPLPMASITKLVSAAAVLELLPLEGDEQGPAFDFTANDYNTYLRYYYRGESALEVPAGGQLTERQLLQGTLVGSANNYIDYLIDDLWGSNADFAAAANAWLATQGVSGVEVVSPSGLDDENVATPAGLLALAQAALSVPVIAQIVAEQQIDLPGAGIVTNTNPLIGDPGVVGLKTGMLTDNWNLLVAKDVQVDDLPVRIYASVQGQQSNQARADVARSLLEQVEAELAGPQPEVPAGTVVGRVSTRWGASADIVTTTANSVLLWNGAFAVNEVAVNLDGREEGDVAGILVTRGPSQSDTTTAVLSQDLPDPSPWWRLTHPLELFGLSPNR